MILTEGELARLHIAEGYMAVADPKGKYFYVQVVKQKCSKAK